MRSVVEEVARALCVASGYDPDAMATGPRLGTYTPQPMWTAFRDLARAAIEAVHRELPGTMVLIGSRIDFNEWDRLFKAALDPEFLATETAKPAD